MYRTERKPKTKERTTTKENKMKRKENHKRNKKKGKTRKKPEEKKEKQRQERNEKKSKSKVNVIRSKPVGLIERHIGLFASPNLPFSEFDSGKRIGIKSMKKFAIGNSLILLAIYLITANSKFAKQVLYNLESFNGDLILKSNHFFLK